MATATKQVHTATSRARCARAVSEKVTLEYLTHRDNGGNYHWEIVDSSGESLVHSGSFDSQDADARAAACVYQGARSARLRHTRPRAPRR